MLDYGKHTDGSDEVAATPAGNESVASDRSGEVDPSTGIVYERGDGQAISTAVAFAVAEHRGVDPVDLAGDTVLGDCVNLELLDSLSTGTGGREREWTFEFTLPRERVTVSSDGRITVTAADD
ncbi:HalOD1 output domain-containing protein [Halobium palmae]|uniref:HalOD1 output domain-containing protein n=1 Tax=Halobium palmae TaxID=1776492 RepID=A0ABD5RYJ8_9EURY